MAPAARSWHAPPPKALENASTAGRVDLDARRVYPVRTSGLTHAGTSVCAPPEKKSGRILGVASEHVVALL